jgi:hypothetical protein
VGLFISALKTKCLAVLERFREAKEAFARPNRIAVTKRSDWIGSMRDSIEISGDIISPANEESEWEALRD